ncbi:hypothetical protein BCU66_012325 [Vibrio sp. 10N.286.49.B1]|uniref:HoxN/HupN/NixA family nickel/cobalt transporter n=1 Tax=unclassified Vibrio TaxID=2614977 RepID=UPI000C8648DE|nr:MULTISPECIES: hypothetical protein [unclassified Vibrio]
MDSRVCKVLVARVAFVVLFSAGLLCSLWWLHENWWMVRWMLQSFQRDLLETMLEGLDHVDDPDNQLSINFWLIGFGVFAYGFVHSLGPGHGKSVLFIAMRDTRPTLAKVVLLALLINLIQGVSTYLVVTVIQWVLALGFKDTITLVGGLNQIVGAAMAILGALGLMSWLLKKGDVLRTYIARNTHDSSRANLKPCGVPVLNLSTKTRWSRLLPSTLKSHALSSYAVMGVIALRPCLSTSLIFLYSALWFDRTVATLLLVASFIGSFLSLLLVSLAGYSLDRRLSSKSPVNAVEPKGVLLWRQIRPLCISTFYILLGWGLFMSGTVTMSPVL